MTYLSKDDDSEIEMRETEHGVAISLRMIEDGEETAGTTFYLTPPQVRGMAEWLSKHSRYEATRECPPGWKMVCEKCGADLNEKCGWPSNCEAYPRVPT